MPTKKEQEVVKTPEQLAMEEKSLERQIQDEEKSLQKQLDEMPKRLIHIPHDPVNPDDVVSLIWNGIHWSVPRGQQFEVPYVFADIWEESYRQTMAVNQRIRESTRKEIQVL